MRTARHLVGLAVLLCGTVLLALLVGATALGPAEVFAGLADASNVVVHQVRLPRALAAVVVGALLALAGVVSQGVFNNSLADPYLMGTASGASLGVAIGALWPAAKVFSGQFGLGVCGFVGALLAVLASVLLAGGVRHTHTLVLSGVAVSSVTGSLTSFLLLRDNDTLVQVYSFSLGSLAFVPVRAVWALAVALLLAWLLCVALAKGLNVLALGEDTAQSLGLSVALLRALGVVLVAAVSALVVTWAGIIGFVGLAAPHIARRLVGADHLAMVLVAPLVGAVMLTLSDTLARVVLPSGELPIGLITAVLGAPFFLYGVRRARG